jgi:hypothetical protein
VSVTRRTEQFIVGCDFGQAADFSAVSVLEQVCVSTTELVIKGHEPPQMVTAKVHEYHLRHLQRLALGTSYPAVVEHVGTIMKALPEARLRPALVVDATGVGRPVVDMLVKARLNPIGVTITGGFEEVDAGRGNWRVPKRNLVSALAVLLQSGRLRIAPGLPEAETLVAELLNFKAKISVAGHDSYGAWRESVHDDLVLATAIAAWWGERKPQPTRQFRSHLMER